MAEAGVASPRFDLRSHGESEGHPQDRILAGILSDIRAAIAHTATVGGVPSPKNKLEQGRQQQGADATDYQRWPIR